MLLWTKERVENRQSRLQGSSAGNLARYRLLPSGLWNGSLCLELDRASKPFVDGKTIRHDWTDGRELSPSHIYGSDSRFGNRAQDDCIRALPHSVHRLQSESDWISALCASAHSMVACARRKSVNALPKHEAGRRTVLLSWLQGRLVAICAARETNPALQANPRGPALAPACHLP